MTPPPDELRAEGILLSTGLVATPDRTSIAAAPQILKELRADLLAVLKQEQPEKFRVVDLPISYLDKLVAAPDIEAMHTALKPYGADLANEYPQVHARARDALIATKPKFSVTTSLGERPFDVDAVTLFPWLHQADALETPLRLAQDVCAAALVKTVLTIFITALPKTYAWLLGELNYARTAVKVGTTPPYWLDHVLQVFMQSEPPPPPAPDQTTASTSKGKGIDPNQLRTDAQSANVPQKG